MLAELLTIVTLSVPTPNGNANVTVTTDSIPSHWRSWPVFVPRILRDPDPVFARENKCQYRIDASRVLRNKPVTNGMPDKCRIGGTINIKPDPYPGS